MRIVAGRWRGRQIDAPKDARVRPTADRVREAWLSIVGTRVTDAVVVDLYAGSGALGLEALSRGAARADFVEINPPSLRALGANIDRLGAGDVATVRRADAARFVAQLGPNAYDVAFADPPYGTDAAVRMAERWVEVPFARLLCVEHAAKQAMPPGGDTRRYGDTAITFYESEQPLRAPRASLAPPSTESSEVRGARSAEEPLP